MKPSDEAFKRLPNGMVAALLKPENREKLRTILTYHVVAGGVTEAQARTVRTAETVADLDGCILPEVTGELRINDATVRIADIPVSNGIIHVIDRVRLPPDACASESASVTASGSATSLIDYAIDRGARSTTTASRHRRSRSTKSLPVPCWRSTTVKCPTRRSGVCARHSGRAAVRRVSAPLHYAACRTRLGTRGRGNAGAVRTTASSWVHAKRANQRPIRSDIVLPSAHGKDSTESR